MHPVHGEAVVRERTRCHRGHRACRPQPVLARVHGFVGFAEQVVGGAGSVVVGDDPDARGDRVRRDERPGFREHRPDPFHEPVRIGFVARGAYEDDELVAAEARDHVLAPHDAPQPGCDLDQDLVAHVVAERVVDVLEIVEVDERQDRRFTLGARSVPARA